MTGTPLPAELKGPLEHALSRRLEAAVAASAASTDPADHGAVRSLARQAREEGVRIASPAAATLLGRSVDGAVARAADGPDAAAVEAARGMVALVRELDLDVDLDVARERVHEALARPGLDERERDLLAPLAHRLGVAMRPLDLPG